MSVTRQQGKGRSGNASPIRQLTIKDEREGRDVRHLGIKIGDDGSLVLEGHDLGSTVAKFWPDDEYEYWLTVPANYRDTVLLWLIKERFSSDVEFREWLDEKGIPHEFANWT